MDTFTIGKYCVRLSVRSDMKGRMVTIYDKADMGKRKNQPYGKQMVRLPLKEFLLLNGEILLSDGQYLPVKTIKELL